MKNLIFFGDSLTAGHGLPAAASFPALLQQRLDHEQLPYKAYNYGVSGERMLLCSLTRTLLEQRGKDVMFLLAGKNVGTLLGHADLHAPYAREDCSDE